MISNSPAETLYPYSWYLDEAAENWSALVMDDYRFIMPLVWKKKYGIRFIYQPVFCQQLGLFSKEHIDPQVTNAFIDQMLKRFRFGVVNFNIKNILGDNRRFDLYDRNNYVLSLQPSYVNLSSRYSVNAKRNLKRSFDQPGSLEKEIPLEEMISFKKKHDTDLKPEAAYQRMLSLFGSVIQHSKGSVYGIRDREELVAAAFIAFSKTRAIYLLSVSSETGKEQRAMFRIVDELIRSYAGSELTLDFEGSNIPSIARFFGGFGSCPEVYQSLSFSRLPIPLILGKKYGR